MPFQFPCSNAECAKTLSCGEDAAGTEVKCPDCGTLSRAPAGGDDDAPRALGEYTIVRKLGEGGMGAVYEAVQKGLDRRVALKVLSERLLDDPTYLERFRREARAAAAFDHPNIVHVFQIGEEGGKHFFSMQFVEGESLQDRLKREGALSVPDALEIVGKVADALDYAWKHGEVIHRDIKPDNILLTQEGQVKVADLGLAKSVQEETRVTTTGVSMGTPAYMAPEQGQDARDVDCRADIYSLGITLYHAIAGRLPFEKRTALSMMMAHVNEPLPDPRDDDPDLPDGVCRVLRKMCAKDPQGRHQTPEELLTDLKTARVDSTLKSRKAKPAAVRPMQERPTVPAARSVREAPTIPEPRRRKRKAKRRPVLPLVLAAAVAALVFGFLVMNRGGPGPSPDPGPGSVSPVVPSRDRPLGGKAAPSAKDQTGSTQKVSVPLQPWDELARGGFEIPEGTEDQHGNPIRSGRDKDTDLPLEIRHKETGMHLVFIPAGEFLMGSPEGEKGRDAGREGTQHKVQLTEPFYLGKYEATQAEWENVMGDNLSKFKGARNPAENVTWTECDEFMKKLNEGLGSGGRRGKDGLRFGLPTEAQWEYACRAGTRTRFCCGDDVNEEDLKDYAWYNVNAGSQTHGAHGVGEKKPNAWGLYDMHGNVWEWCQDWWGVNPGGEGKDPTGPGSGGNRVNRGGGWSYDAHYCRSAFRNGYPLATRTGYVGFRAALKIPETSSSVSERTEVSSRSGRLPGSLARAFEVPARSKDQHGNPVRRGRDRKTGLPLEIRHKQTGMHLVFIPAGEFLMGSSKEEKGWTAGREGTQHKVQLTKPFYLGKYEVTQAEWQKVTGGNPGQFKGDRNPVENVTWADCQKFVTKLNVDAAAPRSHPPLRSIRGCVIGEEPGFLRLTSPTNDQSWAATQVTYSTPVRICLRARTDSTNIRIKYGNGYVIFNWEADPKRLVVGDLLRPGEENEHYVPGKGYLAAGQWHDIVWEIEDHTTRVLADGQLLYTQKGDFSALRARVQVAPAWGSTVDVASLAVESLKGTAPTVKRDTDFRFGLPTEAQWEYACRAGTQTRFYYGEDVNEEALDEYAWYDANSSGRAHPVGGKKPNVWGLYDMHGNVWEWCQDWWRGNTDGEARDPTGPGNGTRRIVRGGSWQYDGTNCRAAFRHNSPPVYAGHSLGCRVALNIPLTSLSESESR